MQLISGTTSFQIPHPAAVAVGKFDGLHTGHRALLAELLDKKREGLKTAVFTFDPSPGAFFAGKAAKNVGSGIHIPVYRELMTIDEKRRAFEDLGIDYLVEFPFSEESAAITPEDYVNQYLLRQMNASLIVAGEDVSFGKNGAGDERLLEKLAEEYNEKNAGSGNAPVEVRIIPKICVDGYKVSSSLVRSRVAEGDMEHAASLLGAPFMVGGIVMRGNGIGHKLDMPTANLYPKPDKLLPPNGVYFSRIRLTGAGAEKDRIFSGITNIGSKPTIKEKRPGISVETNLFDFDEDIYDRNIEVELMHFHRKEMQFKDLDELMEKMSMDKKAAREYFKDAAI